MRAIVNFKIVSLLLLIHLNCFFARAEGFNVPCGSGDCTVFKIDLKVDQLNLMDRNEDGVLFGSIDAIKNWAEKKGKRLKFATNAGIFTRAIVPLGLFVKDNKQIVPLNRQSGSGNFYLKPNGVFFIESDNANIIETSKYNLNNGVQLATQSGPLLLINGIINPIFKSDSDNKLIRSGVGIKNSKELFFVISNRPINFWDFSNFFKEKLKCSDALYLDGTISRMYVPEIKRIQTGGEFAAIFVLLEDKSIP